MSQQIPDLDLAPLVDKDEDFFLIYRAATGTLERATADQILSDVVWREVAKTTLGVAGDTITVNNIPAYTYLQVLLKGIAVGGTLDTNIRFNNDTAANYAHRFDNNGAHSSAVSQANIPMDSGATASGSVQFGTVHILNLATYVKQVIFRNANDITTGAATAPSELSGIGKWVNTTNQITRIDWVNAGTGDFAIGSEIVVMGRN